MSKARRRFRRLGIVATIAGIGYLGDKELNASALARTARVGYYSALILADFKWNFFGQVDA